jgi:demethylmenaquinone methyltransferase/2-methoxy-6-polyprenyl-1,4-benzoquinol methylase
MPRDAGQNRLLRKLLAAHGEDRSQSNAEIMRILERELPSDDFSLSQWRLGLPYFQKRFAGFGLSGRLLIDLGCGTGNWSLSAASRFETVVGVDSREDRIDIAVTLGKKIGACNVRFIQSDIQNLPFGNNEADCVLIYNVLPNIRDWKMILDDVFRILRPGGKFWCSWGDVGISLFYLANGFSKGRASQLKQTFGANYRELSQRLRGRQGTFNGMYLRAACVSEAVRASGFKPLWESRYGPGPNGAAPIFPQKLLGIPFFNEMFAVKPPDLKA